MKHKDFIDSLILMKQHKVVKFAPNLYRIGYCCRCGTCCKMRDVYIPTEDDNNPLIRKTHPVSSIMPDGQTAWMNKEKTICRNFIIKDGIPKCIHYPIRPKRCSEFPKYRITQPEKCTYTFIGLEEYRYFLSELDIWRKTNGGKRKKN